MSDLDFTRGSEWRKWDLHIHTPASFHWNGDRFESDPNSSKNKSIVDEMITALNNAEPSVFAIMDYWTFDGWFELKKRLLQPDSPKLIKKVFPGIELRLMAPMKGRLNAHVLFSDNIDDQELIDFKSNLKIVFPGAEERNLSNSALIEYARSVPNDKLRHHGLNLEEITNNENYALTAGSKMAEISCDSYKNAISKVKNNKAIGFMPFNTSDGLTGIERNKHYAYALGLFKSSPIFETRDIGLWEAFSGIKSERNTDWIDDFQTALNNTPRLAVSGSDAHCFVSDSNDNDQRGYGDYPSGKATWIKANPTFEGLQQAIKEPAKRSFIGEQPPKRKLFNENRSLFIDKLEIQKIPESTLSDRWLDKTNLCLNPDLIAIIGNKGSGKSALADITALLGNSKQSIHFTFLKENRFRGKTGDPAKHFYAETTWCDGATLKKGLNDNPEIESVELVKYIPQGHFEELCNAHVSGESDVFENELRSVIFSHADDATRLGALNFDQLIEQQESTLIKGLDGLRSELNNVNRQIDSIEKQMTPEARKSVEEQINQKVRLLEEHDKTKPKKIEQPKHEQSKDQETLSNRLREITEKIESLDKEEENHRGNLKDFSAKKRAGQNIRNGIEILQRSRQDFVDSFRSDSELIGVDIDKLVEYQFNIYLIDAIDNQISKDESASKDRKQGIEKEKKTLENERENLSKELNAPQKAYQEYKVQLQKWEDKKTELIGNKDYPDSLNGLNHQKDQLDSLPSRRANLQEKRLEIAAEIFDLLNEQRDNREKLFHPVQQLIQSNKLIRDEYKLKFQAELNCAVDMFSENFFSLIKRSSGDFKGKSEGMSTIKGLIDCHDFNEKNSTLEFIGQLHNRVEKSASGAIGIDSMLKKGRTAIDVYNYIFGLEYLTPRYTLMFQGAQIGQLSPGQRGSLLLIFYLLVDKGSTPIILDQPEENLDNETIVSLLVPVLNEAKKKRQIIMVTHNPNLAVVCDAEQIIYCEFDRRNGHNISYLSGAIECKEMNRKVVDVLEGTMPAFDNRKLKYQGV